MTSPQRFSSQTRPAPSLMRAGHEPGHVGGIPPRERNLATSQTRRRGRTVGPDYGPMGRAGTGAGALADDGDRGKRPQALVRCGSKYAARWLRWPVAMCWSPPAEPTSR